jgi:hypothetical protein
MSPPAGKKNRKRLTRAQRGPSLEERLTALHSSMGMMGVIARRRMEDPVAKALDDYDVQRAAALTEKRKARAQARALRSTEIIEDEFNKLREKYPNKDFKKKGPWKTARVLKQRCEREGQLALEADTIARYLNRLPYFSPTDSD